MYYTNEIQAQAPQDEPDFDSYISYDDELFYASSANAAHTPQANNILVNQTQAPPPGAGNFMEDMSLDDAQAYNSYINPGSPANSFLMYTPLNLFA
ncbi:hypothetical protein E8E12_003885 [Didymella heteroderae]|uniref:Uncharacterized protein n=1 Tax=Didymella heteroderae TaxID=1769908 RepID=A0A9P4WMQ2_9PLEO|nr:hypothetical protein E8E12_003885 [Didymella heteroderae]